MLLRFIPFPFSRSLAGDSLTVPGEISSISPIASLTLTGVCGRDPVESLTYVEPLGLPGVAIGESVALLVNSALTLPGESLEGLLSTLVSPEDLRIELSR